MEKLQSVGRVVVDVGQMCQEHGLKKEDLPSGLLTVFASLQRYLFTLLKCSVVWSVLSDLDGIDKALKKCAEVKGVKMVLLRTDMLKTVKRYDEKLSNVHQVFQVCRKNYYPYYLFKCFCRLGFSCDKSSNNVMYGTLSYQLLGSNSSGRVLNQAKWSNPRKRLPLVPSQSPFTKVPHPEFTGRVRNSDNQRAIGLSISRRAHRIGCENQRDAL